MNGSLAQNITEDADAGPDQVPGPPKEATCAGESSSGMTAIPTNPDWESEADRGTVIEEFTELLFLVSVQEWEATGFGLPQDGDRFTVILGDGIARTYALSAKRGQRPYNLDATATNYALRMKWMKA